MDELQVGLALCTQGSAEKVINGRNCVISIGMLMVISPAILVFDIRQSDDYAVERITASTDRLFATVSPHFRQLYDVLIANPCLLLNNEQQRFFIQSAERIRQKRALLGQTTDVHLREVVDKMVLLLEQEVILEFVYIMLGEQCSNVQAPTRQEMIVGNFLKSLYLHFALHRSVEYYAAEANLSQGHFTAIVRQQTGSTPIEWITRITIQQAKHQLRKPGMQVKQVAEMTGFPEQFTFRKYFKTHTGMSPTEYKQQFVAREENTGRTTYKKKEK